MGGASTLTRADISEAIYTEVGLPRHDTAALVDLVLDEVSHALVEEGLVKISSFGSFSVRSKRQRVGRNPKTGQEVPISPRRVLTFRASNTLKARITGGMQQAGKATTPASRE